MISSILEISNDLISLLVSLLFYEIFYEFLQSYNFGKTTIDYREFAKNYIFQYIIYMLLLVVLNYF